MKPYIVLDRFVPSVWRASYVGHVLTSVTEEAGLTPLVGVQHNLDQACSWYNGVLQAGVRRRTAPNGQGTDWHQDGDTTSGARMDQAVVLWASNTPTQFRWNGEIYQPKPYEVVLFNNLSVHHRRPPGAPRIRWTFRQRVEKPGYTNLP